MERDDTGSEQRISTRQLTVGTHSVGSPVYSPDRQYIAYSKRAHGEEHIWIKPSQGGEARQVSFLGKSNYCPAWSPDGKRIAFVSLDETDKTIIKINNLDGNTIKIIENTGISGSSLEWPGDSILIFELTDNKNMSVYNTETEESRLLLEDVPNAWLFKPVLSPGGEWLALRWNNIYDGRGLWIFSMTDTTKIFILKGWVEPLDWSENEDSIYYAITSDMSSADYKYICRINVQDRSIDTLFTIPFDNVSAASISISPDRKQFVANVSTDQKDLWLLENFDPDVK